MASKRVWMSAVAAGLMALGTIAYAESGAASDKAEAPAAPVAPQAPGAAAATASEGGALKIAPDVRKLLDQVDAAYHKIDTLNLSGSVDVAFDVAGKKEDHHSTFESSYKAPGQFRHEIQDDAKKGLQMGSTGEKMYAYQPSVKQYVQEDAPKGQVSAADLPSFVPGLLSQQNPSLLMAIVKDPTVELLQGATSVKKGADQTLDGKTYAVLDMAIPAGEEQVLIDPATGLLKQVKVDLKKMLQEKGAPEVKQAELKLTYTKTETGAAVKEGQFAWTPPADAKDAASEQGESQSAASKLEGQAAPDFTLADLQGKEQKLSAMKGNVVVLDFWATWCPPCRESMPHLNAIYNDLKDKGVNVFAVNLQEDKDKVEAYLKAQKLGMPVLLDSKGTVGQLYKAEAIPQTVVVGKDGRVAKVMIGYRPGAEKVLRDAIAKAMAQK